ncbi:MAG: tRNA adenosine(34) deaminase TadA [Planctomycetota bacterium]|jgi:tRNA(adenine34) deaminase|nr:tRNA adenosine(34) deaminase TadA [Planctomycetota bacterium]
MTDELDEQRMRLALGAACDARESGEVPVGAVIYHRDRLVAKAHNQRETLRDPTAHAEILAITQAAAALDSWRLDDCVLYVTLEPCAMCAGALVLSRMARLVYGARDPKAGACGSVLDVLGCERLNHTVEVTADVLAEPCAEILREFFRKLRRGNGLDFQGD